MAISESQMRAVSKYVKNHYDRIEVKTPKGQREAIKTHAEGRGESVNSFINRAISETMERDKAPQRPQEAPAVQDTTPAPQGAEGIPLHTLEQRVRRILYKHGATIRKDRKSGAYTVLRGDTSRSFPDFSALLEYAQGLDND